MTSVQDHNSEVVRKLTEQNKIAEFAMQTLGWDERRANALTQLATSYFVWDGTLKFKGAHGDVAADDPSCRGFIEREFEFLLPPKSAQEDVGQLDTDDLARARAGNITAKSRLFVALHKGKSRAEEAATLAALDKLLAGDGEGERRRDAEGKFVANDIESGASNPFSRAGWNLSAQGRAYKNDPARAERLAKKAGVHIGATRPAQ